MANDTPQALLTVVRGNPDAGELAAVTAVLLALSAHRTPAGASGPRGPEAAAEAGDPEAYAGRADWSAGRAGYRPPTAWSRA
ncbi:acyl-CoA carboxylase subunit epsilon [Streptomyces verrucosisporus]|uniref:acyl-CoA carboxylase subunit epsilon n=1 Tax=Streptomyces verrucosisporus TaxID=1695161 RepID=UPI0019CF7701|nr:acyl-CoA carboxylase subunit epsilon [Streptomyces verrucosisporus]MBN3931838.1 acyl-CoA carboxylase subunit epsilon [Streptomyces verrucosisporus]